jgi:hypothetical protein
MRGVKPIEYRTRPTKIRGRIYIYASLGRYDTTDEADIMADYGIEDVECNELPRGVLIVTVELHDCTEDFGDHEWHVRDPRRLSELVKPETHPQPVWFNPFGK